MSVVKRHGIPALLFCAGFGVAAYSMNGLRPEEKAARKIRQEQVEAPTRRHASVPEKLPPALKPASPGDASIEGPHEAESNAHETAAPESR